MTREEQLTEFLVREQTRFYRLAYSYLHDREDALDAVQSAVCKALEKQDGLRETGAIRTWFYRILVHTCTDTLRRRKWFAPVSADELDRGSYEDPMPTDGELSERLRGLPPEIQTVIRLRFFEELSLREISEVTNIPVSTAKTRLYTGLKKLRIELESEDLV